MKVKSITFSIYYPGAVISDNHYRGRRRGGGEYVHDEAHIWMDALGWNIKSYHIEDWRHPIRIIIGGRFKNRRSCPDLHNLTKCTCDAIEEVTGINDRHYLTATEDPVIDPTVEPEITITIKEAI